MGAVDEGEAELSAVVRACEDGACVLFYLISFPVLLACVWDAIQSARN